MPELRLKDHSDSKSPSSGASSTSEASPRGPIAAGLARADSSIAGILLRSAECLTALMQSPTAQAGLNESRYNVLDVLRRHGPSSCSQTGLAQQLLQSESNLSTLLDRMKKDGLISRVRSESDRRVTRVALTAAGSDALERADDARARAAASVLQVFDEHSHAALCQALGLLQRRLHRTLGISDRAAVRVDDADSSKRLDRHRSSAIKKRVHRPVRSGATLQNSDEPTT
jgi:DNA-binding MarR family transcriptional regulator